MPLFPTFMFDVDTKFQLKLVKINFPLIKVNVFFLLHMKNLMNSWGLNSLIKKNRSQIFISRILNRKHLKYSKQNLQSSLNSIFSHLQVLPCFLCFCYQLHETIGLFTRVLETPIQSSGKVSMSFRLFNQKPVPQAVWQNPSMGLWDIICWV